jgi:threonine synthase
MKSPWFRCETCQRERALEQLYRCPDCDGELSIHYDTKALRHTGVFADEWQRPGTIWDRFASLLPQEDVTRVVSLGEGSTPLVPAATLGDELGLGELYFKLESCNPTGSFKDRQVSVAISKAREWGHDKFGTASSGNVGVALAAYSARSGSRSFVWVSSSTARAKRDQIRVYGARLFLTPPSTSENSRRTQAIFDGMRRFCLEHGLVPMVSARPVNPFMVEGGKTVAFEIAASLGRAPDRVFAPVGGGGFVGGLWKGFEELLALGLIDRAPVIVGVQTVKGHVPIDRLDDPSWVGTDAFRPLDGRWAMASLLASKGALRTIDGPAVRAAQAVLATTEGIFAEPQGIGAFAGMIDAHRAGELAPGELVVCAVTGAGLKDMQAAEEIIAADSGHPPYREVEGLDDSVRYLDV